MGISMIYYLLSKFFLWRYWVYSSVVERSTADRQVPGSIPGGPLEFFCSFGEREPTVGLALISIYTCPRFQWWGWFQKINFSVLFLYFVESRYPSDFGAFNGVRTRGPHGRVICVAGDECAAVSVPKG